MIKSLRRDNQGVAFVAVIMAMLVLSLLSVAVLTMTTSNLKNGLEEREFQGTYYIAEGGANYYTEDLKGEILEAYTDADTADEFFDAIEASRLDISYNESSILYDTQYGSQPEVDMTLKADGTYGSGSTTRTYIIESTGTLDGIKRRVLKPITIEWLEKDDWKADYAVLTFGDLNLAGGKITGPVFSVGNMNLSNGGAEIDGDVFAIGDVNITSSVKVTGDVYALGDVILSNYGAEIGGNVYACGNIVSTGTIKGSAYADGSATGKQGNITITGWNRYIEGDAYAKGIITNSAGQNIIENIKGTLSENDVVLLPEFPDGPVIPGDGTYPDFPVFPEKADCHQLATQPYGGTGNRELVLTSARTYIPKIDTGGSVNLTIKYSDKQILMVDEFIVGGGSKVYLEGEGTLKLYVNNKLNLNACPLNHSNSTDLDEIDKTRDKLEIYAKGNDVKATGGGARLLTKLLYAPEAVIPLAGDGNVVGPVIAKEVVLSGSHKSASNYNPEGGAPGGATPPDADDLVIIGPVKEK